MCIESRAASTSSEFVRSEGSYSGVVNLSYSGRDYDTIITSDQYLKTFKTYDNLPSSFSFDTRGYRYAYFNLCDLISVTPGYQYRINGLSCSYGSMSGSASGLAFLIGSASQVIDGTAQVLTDGSNPGYVFFDTETVPVSIWCRVLYFHSGSANSDFTISNVSVSYSGLYRRYYGTNEAINEAINDLQKANNANSETLKNAVETGNAIAEQTKNNTKSILSSITEFFASFFEKLVDSVISLFVPSTADMSELFDKLNQFFSDRFGFLYAPFDYVRLILQSFLGDKDEMGMVFPGFELMGHKVWDNQYVVFSKLPLVDTVCTHVRTVTGILLSGYFVMYLYDFFKERFGSG